jgi:hypothetical protein
MERNLWLNSAELTEASSFCSFHKYKAKNILMGRAGGEFKSWTGG